MRQVIVTGVNGFVGSHLADALREAGYGVIGVGREQNPSKLISKKLNHYLQCDLTDYSAVERLPLNQTHALINLAGLAAVGPSFDQPDLYMKVNTDVLGSVCEAAIKQNAHLRILSISSGAVYAAHQALPLTESSSLDKDSSPYAASKIAMEELALRYRRKGLDCTVARPFNHIGPGQGLGFLLPDLYQRISGLSNEGKLHIGNLTTRRDYTDVRDVVSAYVALIGAETLNHPVYNVCSGRSVGGQELLGILLKKMGKEYLELEVDPSLFRPSDAPDLYGSSALLQQDTNWKPEISLTATVSDFVDNLRL